MAMVRWNPYRNMWHINHELENILEDFAWPFSLRRHGEEEGGDSPWLPAVDLSETKEGYVIKAELPGVSKEDVKVTVAEDVLTIAGEKKTEQETKNENLHRSERTYGSFSRSFRLPGPVNSDKIHAEYRNGVLTLNVPKAESAKPREIQIQ